MTDITLCDDNGTIHDTISVNGGMDNLVGLTVTAGRSWLVYPDGTNLMVTPVNPHDRDMKAGDLLTTHPTDNGMEIRLPATVPPYKMRQQYYRYELQSDTDIQALAAEINGDALSDPADPVRLTGTVQYLEAHTPNS